MLAEFCWPQAGSAGAKMSSPEPIGHPDYLKPQGSLQPANAAVALIVDEAGRYLVQLRDAKPTIFFPQHWGCFGGAVEPGETDDACLARELQEELDLDLSCCAVRRFTTFTFDFGFAGGSVIHRVYYEVQATDALLAYLKLAEGQAMQLFPGPQLLGMQVVPYDRFAIWMHCYQVELRAPSDHAASHTSDAK
jgi:8-oxo-dGTP diphosphatase